MKRKSIGLTLIQCGATPWDAAGRLHGRCDLPLSIDGRAEITRDVAQLSGRRLPIIHHASDDAAAETAQIAARVTGARTKSIAELADADLGVLDGMTKREFAERFPKRYKQWEGDPLSLSPPDGEDVAEARARVLAACSRLLRRPRGEEVAVVLHPLGLGFLRCWLAERAPSDLWALLEGRPTVERYVLAPEMAGWLAEIARTAAVH